MTQKQAIAELLQQKAGYSRKYLKEFGDKDAFGKTNTYINAISIIKSALNQQA